MAAISQSKGRFARIGLIAVMIGIMTIVELFLLLSDFGVFGERGYRTLAYQNAGFWPGLLTDWSPNYPYQAWLMFGSYAFLHGGLVHLAVNMLTLWSLGRPIVERVGNLDFVLLYAASILGGAIGYAVLASSPQPMVGASGALFGLAGAWLAWQYVDRFTYRGEMWPLVRVALMLIALNVVLYYSRDGQIAWQTHLGGFIIGWIAATLIDPTPRQNEEEEDGGSA